MQQVFHLAVENQAKTDILLNREILERIKNAKNPKFLLFAGSTRTGKSTTLNHLALTDIEHPCFIRKEPFEASNKTSSVTVGCDILGPIKYHDLLRRFGVAIDSSKPDYDVFLCDSEGFGSLQGISTKFLPGVLASFCIATQAVFLVNTSVLQDNVDEILCQHSFAEHNQKILKMPLTATTIFVRSPNFGPASDADGLNLQRVTKAGEEITRINNSLSYRSIPPESFGKFSVVISGPYEEIPNPKAGDMKLDVYMKSLRDIVEKFKQTVDESTVSLSGPEVAEKIELLFDIFRKIDELPKYDSKLTSIIQGVIIKAFDEILNQNIIMISQKIEEDLETALKISADPKFDYIKSLIQIDDQKKALFDSTIPQDMENKIKNCTIELYNQAKMTAELHINAYTRSLVSTETIDKATKDYLDYIHQKSFREEIDTSFAGFPTVDQKCEEILHSNETIYKFLEETNPGDLETLKSDVNERIKEVIDKEVNAVPLWDDLLKIKTPEISNFVQDDYNNALRPVKYQEDFEKVAVQPEAYGKSNLSKIISLIFKDLALTPERQDQVFETIVSIASNIFSIFDPSKLQKFNSLLQSFEKLCQLAAEDFIRLAINNAKVRDDVDQSKCSEESMINYIKQNVQMRNDISGDKLSQVNDAILHVAHENYQQLSVSVNALPTVESQIANVTEKVTDIVNAYTDNITSKLSFKDQAPRITLETLTGVAYSVEGIANSVPQSHFDQLDKAVKEICKSVLSEFTEVVNSLPSFDDLTNEILEISNQIINRYITGEITTCSREDIRREILRKCPSFRDVDTTDADAMRRINMQLDKVVDMTHNMIMERAASVRQAKQEGIPIQQIQQMQQAQYMQQLQQMQQAQQTQKKGFWESVKDGVIAAIPVVIPLVAKKLLPLLL